ncbi:hypothetical protein ACNQFN_11545 [Thauera butanivorans]|uniref:hypothetical protein n=1 Tax=Thauera butanivorans TaxID=86174 RepID=UPI003AB1A16D
MKVIEPTTITPDLLVSSSVPEDDAQAWNAGTSYSIGEEVMDDHAVFEALQNNVGKPPRSNPDVWLPLGAVNRWKMFDGKVGVGTTADDAVSIVARPGLITGIALIGVVADSVTVSMTDATEGVVFEEVIQLQDTKVVHDWTTYFFEPIRRRNHVVVTGLPMYRNAEVAVTVSAPGERVTIGELVLGRLHVFAKSFRYGASFGIRDFSKKTRDDWGNWFVREGAYSRRGRWPVLVDNNMIDSMAATLDRLRFKAAVYVGSPRWDAAVIYGFYIDYDIVIPYPTYSELAIEIEGLT